jgi:hypothetical protein
MSDYVLGSAVEFDLDEIWEYIATDNIDAARREKVFREPAFHYPPPGPSTAKRLRQPRLTFNESVSNPAPSLRGTGLHTHGR